MKTVEVSLDNRSYDICIAPGLIHDAQRVCAPFFKRNRWIVVTDNIVAELWLDRLEKALGARVERIILPSGESTKSWANLEMLCDQLLALEVERSDTIIALGGGVIGDLTGFAAAIIKRGCSFIQIPTTLLAQVDSSVGGKTAINARAGKNLIGAFYQPALVLIDPSVLDTLPIRHLRAGYAEVVKYGLIGDAAFYDWCEENAPALMAGDVDARIYAIEQSIRFKAKTVESDERETEDKRALLNLGHTFGHALEAETGFSDKLLHGEAVAAGMALAFQYSAHKGICDASASERVVSHLGHIGLPNSLKSADIQASGTVLTAHMAHDKKATAGKTPFILARGIGQSYVDHDTSLSDVAAFLDGTA